MQISIWGYIAPKESELFYDCADRYAFDQKRHKFAISDGVSTSFFPKIWSEVLVNRWVQSDQAEPDAAIVESQKDWVDRVTKIVKQPETKWFTKNAFNRKDPGLATFVGLNLYQEEEKWYWEATALGDSFLFFLPKGYKSFSEAHIALSSKQEPFLFDNYPDYFSSVGTNHKGESQKKKDSLAAGTFYLMTDAVAEWFLNEKEDAINKMSVWESQDDFVRFINEERISQKLGNDDVAILIIQIEEDGLKDITYNSKKITEIEDLIKKEQAEAAALSLDNDEDKESNQLAESKDLLAANPSPNVLDKP